MTQIKHAVICAAGLGSRLGHNKPKCLVEINQKKIIDYQLELLQDIDDIRLVVGFQKERVVAHVRTIRNDITFITNDDYAVTSSSYSAYLATQSLTEPFLLLAGDLLIDPKSFHYFLEQCTDENSLIGVTRATTENPVYVKLDQQKNLVNFSKKRKTKFEWPCVAYFNNIPIDKTKKYIFENLIDHLPIQAVKIDCYEIDTPKDLERVEEKYACRISTDQPPRNRPF